ncbi:MAG: hypothetical protein ABIR70_08530 [Bryobacteraceae bacterium]
MTTKLFPAVLSVAAFAFMIACASAPTAAVKVEKELKAIVETPVTGKTAFWEMYKLGHAWSADMQVLFLKNGKLVGSEEKGKGGEATEWTLMVASPSKREAHEFTYRAISVGTKRKGVVSGTVQPWGGPTAKGQPFTTAEMKLDSNEAFDKAAAKAATWNKENPGKEVSFYLGKESKYPAPVWAVLWGGEKAGYLVVVNALDGSIIK